jgi:hypothetical protein
MRRLFLFSDLADNFEALSTAFVEAAGGRSARIALLLAGGPGWERYVPRYRAPWMRLGAAEVIPIAPLGDDLRLWKYPENEWERDVGPYPAFAKLEPLCHKQGIMRTTTIGKATVKLLRLRELIELYAQELAKNPDMLYSEAA